MEIGLVIPLITGLAGGWVSNYLTDVLPATRRLSRPACPYCETAFSWQDYLLLHHCRSCGRMRRVRSWVIHLLFIAVSFYIWISPPPKIGFALGSFLLLYFTTVLIIDLEHRLILHPTSIVGAFLGLGVGYLRWGWGPTLTGGLFGFGIMLLFYRLGVAFTRLRARRMRAAGMETDDEDALGQGDVILATILGLALGWPLIWFALLLGILLGGAVSLLLMLGFFLSGQYKNKAWMVFIPYGPCFIVSAFLLIYFPLWMSALVPK